MDEIGDEENDEGHGGADETAAATTADILIVHIVHHIEDAQHPCEEYHGKAQHEHPGIEQGIETMGGIRPAGDDRRDGINIDEIVLLDDEVRSDDAVEGEEELERLRTEDVADLVLELIADGLQHECEEDNHPEPVGSAEAGGVEEGERGEEGTSERDERGERKFPLTACGVIDETSAFFRLAQ